MDQPQILRRVDRVIKPVKNLFLAVASAILAVMMFMTALDVALRYLFSSPIPGGLELMEYFMAILIPFAVMITGYNKAHVGVDLIMERMPISLQRWAACITSAMMVVFFGLITWQCSLHIVEQYHSGLTSAVLLIPHYPFVASLTAAFALLTVITFFQFIEYVIEGLA